MKGHKTTERVVTTEIEFENLSEVVIENYIQSNEWEGNAGGYKVEGKSCSTFVKRFNGCFYNVMGLPLNELCNMLIEDIEYSRKNKQ